MLGMMFTGWSVRAMWAGRKTQSRRILKADRFDGSAAWLLQSTKSGRGETWEQVDVRGPKVGDQVYVKERWDYFGGDEYMYQRDRSQVLYDADMRPDHAGRRWRTPLFMPRWAARMIVTITDVRLQRLHDITEEDALAEGVDPVNDPEGDCWTDGKARTAYEFQWGELHGWNAWERNPVVVARTFTVEKVEPTC